MQTSDERFHKMTSLAQIGWWEADISAGTYLCSDYLCELLGLEGDTISSADFLNMVREDYREQIFQEFRASASIHKDFYEQTFPIITKDGEEVWLHTRLGYREKGTGTGGGDKSFGVIQRVEAPKDMEEGKVLRRVNDLLRRQNFISQSLLRFLKDEEVDTYVLEILNNVLSLYQESAAASIYSSTMLTIRITVAHTKWCLKASPPKKTSFRMCLPKSRHGGHSRYCRANRLCSTRSSNCPKKQQMNI